MKVTETTRAAQERPENKVREEQSISSAALRATPEHAAVSSSLDGRLPFAVLGGGISGLALATWLRDEGIDSIVLEKSDRPGGVIGTVQRGEFLFERGPTTVLDRDGSIDGLIRLAGLEEATQRTRLKDHARYIWHGGRLHTVPVSPGSFLTTRLFSFPAKARLLREAWTSPVQGDESLEDFVIRRLGREFLDRAIAPMVNGLWAGDPAKMSTAASFPLLKELERSSGSLVKGFLATMKARRRKQHDPDSPRSSQMVSFQGGLQRLPEALATNLGEALIASTEVKQIQPDESGRGYRVMALQDGSERTWIADGVALCGDAAAVAGWIEAFEPGAARQLRAVHYCPLAVVGLGIESASLRLPSGFGFLAARDQGLRILGAIFNSNFLPDRAPQGSAALTVMIGGDLDPEGAALSDADLFQLVQRDLRAVLGWDGKASCHHIERWPRAIPRYSMDYFELIQSLEDVESRHPGLTLFGNWRGGVSISDRIKLAHQEASAIAKRAGARK
ncbi:protoporphyrinogen oxidase [Candidatus Sumerlaeota bacterium]|nr:protoporphyrinogen oxidase [Candidatus Sumerlaeota bacterium]